MSLRLPSRPTQFLSYLTLLAGLAHVKAQGEGHFFFEWPTSTTQCGVIDLIWRDAVPPFTAYIIPTWNQPFVYHIPDSAYSNGIGNYSIQVQLPQGAYYTMFMNDGQGFGSGGSAEIQIVGASSRTSCLNTAAANQSSQEFSFTVAGQAKQCMDGFDLNWTGGRDGEPYNFSVIPLDQGFYPFEVKLDGGDSWDDGWGVNMTAGSRFTVMMNNKNGYGKGGVAGVYQVANSTQTACFIQPIQATGSWPNGLATNTLPVPTGPRPTQASSLGGGAIAGIVIGVLVILAIIGIMVWFLLRRKRRRDAENKKLNRQSGVYPVDLGPEVSGEDEDGDNGYGDGVGMVEPYRHNQIGSNSQRSGNNTSGQNSGNGPFGDSRRESDRDLSGERSPIESSSGYGLSTQRSSAGFAGLGAGQTHSTINGQTPIQGEDDLLGEGNSNGPGIAGPLPPKLHLSIPSQPSMTGNQMRITNPSNPTTLLPDSGSGYPPNGNGVVNRGGHNRRRSDHNDISGNGISSPNRTFRRHEDAGRVRISGNGNGRNVDEEEVVDLPPLYTDIRRDEDEGLSGSGSGVGERGDVGNVQNQSHSPVTR